MTTFGTSAYYKARPKLWFAYDFVAAVCLFELGVKLLTQNIIPGARNLKMWDSLPYIFCCIVRYVSGDANIDILTSAVLKILYPLVMSEK